MIQMPSKTTSTKLVYIRWKDAHYQEGEISIEEIDQTCILHSVGFIIKDTPEAITISVEQPDGGFVRNPFSIPRSNIIEIQETTLNKAFKHPSSTPKRTRKAASKKSQPLDTALLSGQDQASEVQKDA